jgi:tRNA-dihydrouridine synthase B
MTEPLPAPTYSHLHSLSSRPAPSGTRSGFVTPEGVLIPLLQGTRRGAHPSFQVGSVPVYGNLILAPMDGLSGLPFRAMARVLGSAMSYTEFINAGEVIYNLSHLEERLQYEEAERPVVFQLMDNNPEQLLKAAVRLRASNPDIIDINMGCSTRPTSARGAGAGLLREPGKVAQIFSSLTHELDIPITAKIRLGWDEASRNYLEIARIIQDNGGALVAVHGRTRQQAYTGCADWDAIAEVKQALSIPVIANGDVRCVADIRAILAHTGCEAVMIGRAAVANPWIFAGLDRTEVPIEQVRTTLRDHLARMLAFYGTVRGLVQFRKYAKSYLKPYHPPRPLQLRMLTTEVVEEFLELADQILTDASASSEQQQSDPYPCEPGSGVP